MIELQDTVPPHVIHSWKEERKRVLVVDDVPPRVAEFIDAIANELGDFEQNGKYAVLISGYELELANIKEIGGEKICRSDLYPIDVPIMQAVDHRGAMRKQFIKYGKQGLINYLKAKCDPAQIPSLKFILEQHVLNG